MEEQIIRKPRSGPWKWILGILAVLILAMCAGGILLFRVNRFTFSVELEGEPEKTVAFGSSYAESGARAVLRGTLFWKEGFTPEGVEIKIHNEVDESKLGKYTVTYTASFRNWQESVQRTVRIVDNQPPVIILKEDIQKLPENAAYQEAGYSAYDNYDGDITDRVVRREHLGLVTYSVLDSAGNPAYAEREIPYFDPIPPEIILAEGNHIVIDAGTKYADPGYRALDNGDGDISSQVVVEGEVVWYVPGSYPITYTVTDSRGNTASVTRTVEVVAKPRPETVIPDQKTIYLTFDDGPSPYTQRLLDVLDEYGVKATFFVVNSDFNDVMKEIVERGHSIGIHSVTHEYDKIYISPEAYFEDLYGMQKIIYDNTGVMTTLMRFPGGGSNTVSYRFYRGLMTLLTQAVQDAGFQYFDWNVDSKDAGGARNAKTVFENVTESVEKLDTAIVLQHDIHAYSVEAVEDIIRWGLDNGYQFLPLTPDSPGMHHGLHN